ncbi:MAG: AAA family ATPase [Ignavibacteria bacterium]|jgi:phage nucleotide-binding protein|nr:AAA family ATPase [Ignavibacteria bacterium]
MPNSYIVTPDQVMAKGFNLLIYGNPGCGKTILAASAQYHPKMTEVLVLNIEGGLMSVAHSSDIRAIDIHNTQEVEDIFWKLYNHDKEYAKVRTVVIDSLTELQTINLEEIVRERNPNKLDDIYQQDYKKSTAMLKRITRWYKELPMNFIATALPAEEYSKSEDGKDQLSEIHPAMTKKLCLAVQGYMDAVWYMYATETKVKGEEIVNRHLMTRDHGVYKGKTRGIKFSQALGLKVDNPTMPMLYDMYVNSEVEEQNENLANLGK